MNSLKIAERLTKILAANNMTHKALADLTGIGRATIGNYCEGTRTPDAFNLAKIAEAFNVSTDYLIGLSDSPNATCIKTQVDVVNMLSEIAEKLKGIILPTIRDKGKNLYDYELSINFNGNYEIIDYFVTVNTTQVAFSGMDNQALADRMMDMLQKDLKEKLANPIEEVRPDVT